MRDLPLPTMPLASLRGHPPRTGVTTWLKCKARLLLNPRSRAARQHGA